MIQNVVGKWTGRPAKAIQWDLAGLTYDQKKNLFEEVKYDFLKKEQYTNKEFWDSGLNEFYLYEEGRKIVVKNTDWIYVYDKAPTNFHRLTNAEFHESFKLEDNAVTKAQKAVDKAANDLAEAKEALTKAKNNSHRADMEEARDLVVKAKNLVGKLPFTTSNNQYAQLNEVVDSFNEWLKEN